MEGATCQIIYAAKVPKSRFSVATAIELSVLLLIIIGTIAFPVPITSNSVLVLLFFIVIEIFLLLRLLDLFLWHNFGQEKIIIEDGRLIVENRNRLLGKVRSIHLSEIDHLDVDHRDSWLIFSSWNKFLYMRYRGSIVVHTVSGTRMRLCMSAEPAVIQKVSDAIMSEIMNEIITI